MAHGLYRDFLENSEAYHACERFWRRMTAEIATSLGQAATWRPWIPRHYPNGKPVEKDGNPIWDGRSEELDRAFRIIQFPLKTEDLTISAWLKEYPGGYPDLPRHELVINLTLTDESAKLAETLLAKWMDPATTREHMEVFIAEQLFQPSENAP